MQRLGKLRLIATILSYFCVFAVPAQAQESLDQPLETIRGAVRADEAMEFMRQVYSTDRWFTFPKFLETAEYLRRTMEKAGLDRVEILGAPADGKTQAGYWTMPLAWDAKEASLEIVEPSLPLELASLADYQKMPTSLGMWSGPSPAGGVVAEVVDLQEGDPAKIAKMNLGGKFALTRVNPANVKWALVKAGALGAINTFSENPDLLDDRQWINAWGDNGWAFTGNSTPLISFSITPRQAALLRKLLAERGIVRVKATVESRYYKGVYPYVTGILTGTGPEEVLTLGHSSEQGAQDNATGVAAMLESLATLERLISSGKLPRPKRSIRMLAMGEMYGSMHYIETHQERTKRTVAALCMDVPAGPYELAGSEYTVYANPHSGTSYTDALIAEIAGKYLSGIGRPWHEREYTVGTDTYLSEPMVNIPTVWIYSDSASLTHHNSADIPSKADARSLRDLVVINAAYLYYLANSGEKEALWLARLSHQRGHRQIQKSVDSVLERVAGAHTTDELGRLLQESMERTTYASDREGKAILAVTRLVPEENKADLEKRLSPLVEELRRAGDETQRRVQREIEQRAAKLGLDPGIQPIVVPSRREQEAARIVVRRNRPGTLPLDEISPSEREGFPSGAWDKAIISALYWCDGHRTLAEVIHLTEMETGPTSYDLVAYFRFLRKHGYVEFVRE